MNNLFKSESSLSFRFLHLHQSCIETNLVTVWLRQYLTNRVTVPTRRLSLRFALYFLLHNRKNAYVTISITSVNGSIDSNVTNTCDVAIAIAQWERALDPEYAQQNSWLPLRLGKVRIILQNHGNLSSRKVWKPET